MRAVIHHNPECGTSRNVLALLRAARHDVVVIPYLETGWTRPQLLALFAACGLTPREALRVSKTPAADLGLTDPSVDDAGLLDAMLLHPILVNRPIVATVRGVRLCRPSEAVLDLIDTWPEGPFAKEDGALIITEDGSRAI